MPRGVGISDDTMSYKIPPDGRPTGNQILNTDPICKSTQQTMSQTDAGPRLQAAAGSYVALRYQENGHVTLPQNQPGKPANRGTVFVYGTTQSKPDDTLLAIHKIWNTAGTGGDGRGKLITTQNFDDGQCYQPNGGDISTARTAEFKFTPTATTGSNLWCQNDIVLPSDASSGKPYTLYWVWDWPTAENVDKAIPTGKPELYTTCMDIDITASPAKKDTESVHYIQSQDLAQAGVSSYVNDLARGNKMVATQSGQAAETGASSSEASQASSSSTPPAISSAAVPAPPSTTLNPSTYIPPSVISAAPVESPSQAPSAAASGVVTIYVTVSLPPAPSAPQYTVTSTVTPPLSSSPSNNATTTADGSACGATKVQKRSRILDGATRHRFPNKKLGYVRRNRKSTVPGSAKFRHL